jgi:uncharacterized protein YoxC
MTDSTISLDPPQVTSASAPGPVPLTERLAALKERMATNPEADSLTTAMGQLDAQQGHLLSLVASLTDDVQSMHNRIDSLEAMVRSLTAALAEVHEHIDSAALAVVETVLSST